MANVVVCYENYAEVIINNNKGIEVARAIVDLEDIDFFKKHTWHLSVDGYISSRIGGKIIKFHRLLLNVPSGLVVDHIDRNKLNNKKCNLRVCKQIDNVVNTGMKSNNTSGIIGVCFDNKRNKWVARISNYKKVVLLGRFDNKEDAIYTRLQAEKKLLGEFAPQRHLFEQYEIKGE